MKLVIVESPNKCKTISHYLGDGYLVKASQGHLRDLSTKGAGGFGIDPEHDFKPNYIIDSKKYKIVNELRSLSKSSEEVILATDPDREGEAIAWHLAQILDLDIASTKRLEFHEITKDSLTNAIASPRTIDMNIVQSQESRRIIDRVIGFKLSTVMQKKLKSPSAGRVQSATLKLICDHEDEITSFVPEEYWTLSINIGANEDTIIKANYYGLNGKPNKITNKEQNDEILNKMSHFVKVIDIKTSTKKVESKLPFTTSSLQQEAFNAFGFGASKTSSLAQKLYEGVEIDGEQVGLITYIRTDSTVLSNDFVNQAAKYIASHFGKEYLGAIRKGKEIKNSQGAHEAIRPTNIYRFPDAIKNSFKGQYDLYRLYKLIYQRSVASLMAPKVEQITSFLLDSNGVNFKFDGSKDLFDGYTKLYKFISKDDENEEEIVKDIPDLHLNEEYAILEKKNKQEFTTPPARYSEAKIVKLMEEKGIGRPSTYASTIATLIKHKYITSQKGIVTPTEVGYRTNHVLEKYFPAFISVNYTADMETKLDQIQEGKLTKTKVLTDFYYPFIKEVDEMTPIIYKDKDIEVGRNCPICGSPLVYKTSSFGEFVGCSNYPTCKYKEGEEKEVEYLDEKCPECGGRLVYRKKGKTRFIGCSNYPTCHYIRNEKKEPKIVKVCPECGGNLIEKTYKGHKYLGCSNYPKCRHSEKIKKD